MAERRRPMSGLQYAGRTVSLAMWAYATWILLTWTATAEQLLFGAGLALAVSAVLAPLGPAVGPWHALTPRRLASLLWLAIDALRRIVRANLSLARREWSPSRPLHSGMVVVAT